MEGSMNTKEDIFKYLNFNDIHIAVIGDCMLDIYHYGVVDRISPEAPVPIFKANNTEPEYRLGGACNTALNLAKLGVKTSLFGFIGKDINATYIKQYLLEYDINYNLVDLPNFPTITKNRYFSKNQQIIRIDQEDTNGELYIQPERSIMLNNIIERCNNYDAIIISDYGKGALYFPVLSTIMNKCCNIPIFIDPKLNQWQFYKGAFCITPNWKEFKDAFNLSDLEIDDTHRIRRTVEDVCKLINIEYVLITLGSKGMYLINKEGNFISSPNVEVKEVYDVSGAGDTVIATLAAAYCKEYPLNICMQLAKMAAKVVIGKLGTYAVTVDELRLELIREIRKDCRQL
jgi:D-beta-D-heptose 7-phosphate kinase/D-beta-D-heptose 1-phosphate adenosyltransferase